MCRPMGACMVVHGRSMTVCVANALCSCQTKDDSPVFVELDLQTPRCRLCLSLTGATSHNGDTAVAIELIEPHSAWVLHPGAKNLRFSSVSEKTEAPLYHLDNTRLPTVRWGLNSSLSFLDNCARMVSWAGSLNKLTCSSRSRSRSNNSPHIGESG